MKKSRNYGLAGGEAEQPKVKWEKGVRPAMLRFDDDDDEDDKKNILLSQTPTMQHNLKMLKNSVRLLNQIYLRQHPEVMLLINDLLRKMLESRPTCAKDFCAFYFSRENLLDHLDELVDESKRNASFKNIIKSTPRNDDDVV